MRNSLLGVGVLSRIFQAVVSLLWLLVWQAERGLGFQTDFERSRKELLQELRAQGIRDPRVLAVIEKVPRHEFVPAGWQSMAYANRALPIKKGQTISQPYIVALMTELLELKGTEKVLEVGTGSGYQAAVLSLLADRTYTIEIIPELSQSAREKLEELGYENVEYRVGDGFYGWKEKAPFDAIIVTAAARRVPKRLLNQLRDGGVMVIPLGPPGGDQRLVRIKKDGGQAHMERITGVRFVPMTGEIQKEE